MADVSLTFYLGSPAVPVADSLATALGERLGVTVDFDRDASDAARRATLDRPPPGILWMCGLDTIVRQQDGRLDAEIAGAPVFPGRDGPIYDSVIVAAEGWRGDSLDDLAGATLAINEPESWSGHHALRAHLASRGRPHPTPQRIVVSGSHEASIDALLGGLADCATIEDTVWAARLARDPRAATLRVIARTEPWPAPPFSLVRGLDRGLASAVVDALLYVRVSGLRSIAPASAADYAVFRDGLAASRSLAWSAP